MSVDPVAAREKGDNFNRYAYANNNPYKFKDPDGRESACFANGVGCGLRAKTAEDNRKTAVAFTGLVATTLTAGAGIAAAPAAAAAVQSYGAGLVAVDAAVSQAGRQVAGVAVVVVKEAAKIESPRLF